MTSPEILSWLVLGGGVIALAVQYGIHIGQQRREQHIERQRGAEVKTLLEHITHAWRKQ